MSDVATQAMRYLAPSAVERAAIMLRTYGGRCLSRPTEHPVFFEGFLTESEQSAMGMCAVARVAATRYYDPRLTRLSRDPVVTSNGDRLRFESFSGCGGVYSRLDIEAGGIDGEICDRGTTNVDFNAPFVDALARIGPGDPVRLVVGADEVSLSTLDARVVERKVPLPEAWLRGFAETSVLLSRMRPRAELTALEARRFLGSLPRGTGPVWVMPSGRSVRLTAAPRAGAVCLAGAERLAELRNLLRFGESVRIYGPAAAPTGGRRPVALPSAWELRMRHARLVVVLSPERHRGLAAEGSVLDGLADDRAAEDAEALAEILSFDARIDIDDAAARTGLSQAAVRRSLVQLATAGRVGFDSAEGAYFHRELPYDRQLAGALNPRLAKARLLVDQHRVRTAPEGFVIDMTDHQQHVRLLPTVSCTCRWWARYGTSRGPCTHVLAVRLAGER